MYNFLVKSKKSIQKSRTFIRSSQVFNPLHRPTAPSVSHRTVRYKKAPEKEKVKIIKVWFGTMTQRGGNTNAPRFVVWLESSRGLLGGKGDQCASSCTRFYCSPPVILYQKKK